MTQWFGLSGDLLTLLEPFYRNGHILQASFDTDVEAAEIIWECGGRALGVTRCTELAQQLKTWSDDNCFRFKRYRSSLTNDFIGRTVGSSSSTIMPSSHYDVELLSNIVLNRIIKKSSLSKSLVAGNVSKQTLENTERDKWALVIAQWLDEANLPASILIKTTAHPVDSWKRAFGSKRARTLRNRARLWKHIRL